MANPSTSSNTHLTQNSLGMHSRLWMLDNCVIDHITYNLASLKDVTFDPILSLVKIPTGESMKVEALGNVELIKRLVLV